MIQLQEQYFQDIVTFEEMSPSSFLVRRRAPSVTSLSRLPAGADSRPLRLRQVDDEDETDEAKDELVDLAN
jgi:hypothetical protein